ncbi:MAG: GntR family transcriptional regulator [Clostridia bacterium]|nr:GntR family transcriptional regulator [Clostridia bacterium]
MAWKFQDGIPLTVQISDRLRKDILRGEYRAGEDFPTVRQIAADAAVNPNTVQKALVILEDEGLLITLGTAGRTVTDDTEKIAEARERVSLSFVAGVVKEARLLGISEDALLQMIKEEMGK